MAKEIPPRLERQAKLWRAVHMANIVKKWSHADRCAPNSATQQVSVWFQIFSLFAASPGFTVSLVRDRKKHEVFRATS